MTREVAGDGERALVRTQGVPTGRRRTGLLFPPLRERFRGRGGRRALLCTHTCAPCCWSWDCAVPVGRTPPMKRRRARARVGRSRVACVGVYAVSAQAG